MHNLSSVKWNTSKVSLLYVYLCFVPLGHGSSICPYQRRHAGRILQTGRKRRSESVSLWQLRLTLVGPSPEGVYCMCKWVNVLKYQKVENQSFKCDCICHRLCALNLYFERFTEVQCYVSRNRNRESESLSSKWTLRTQKMYFWETLNEWDRVQLLSPCLKAQIPYPGQSSSAVQLVNWHR